MARVVVTGMGVISPLGNDWTTALLQLKQYRNCVCRYDDWAIYKGLNTRLGVPAAPFELPAHYHRKSMRSMGRVALMATRASELALADAGLLDDPVLKSGLVGIAYGSSAGSPSSVAAFGQIRTRSRSTPTPTSR